MSQSKREIKKKFKKTINLEDETHLLAKKSHKKYSNLSSLLPENHNKRIEDVRKRDFVSRVYRDLGFICEV
jgi:hypothetical protein